MKKTLTLMSPTCRPSSFYSIRFLILLLILPNLFMRAQESGYCYTTPSSSNYLETISTSTPPASIQQSAYTFRIYVHIIRNSDGTGGRSVKDVKSAVEKLNEDFSPHNIQFDLSCIEYLDNNIFFNIPELLPCDESNIWILVFGLYPIFLQNTHTDGLDIYLLPNSSNFKGGLANGVPGTALVVGGTTSMDNVDVGLSSALSHEMGHCLGLFHTFHGSLAEPYGCPELVNQPISSLYCQPDVVEPNCCDCGDYVCDTPADPYLGFNVDIETCFWLGPITFCDDSTVPIQDAEGNYYSPSTTNIMAYSPISCYEGFTLGQEIRMKMHILYNPDLQARLTNSPQQNLLDDDNWDIVWNTPTRVFETVNIAAGSTLTIQNTNVVFEGDDAGLLVMPGGKLLVSNSTLSNDICLNTHWKGIQVLGDPDEPHPAEPFNPQTGTAPSHGIAYLYNNTKIENARIGVATAMLDNEDKIIANTGGIVWAEGNTLFKNNQVGTLIANPNNALLRISRIQNCRFETTDDYIEGSIGIYGNGRPVGIVSRSGKLSAVIKNNVFINLQSTIETKERGIGIFNSGTGMRIGEPGAGNRFENLYKGIDYYSGPSLLSAISINSNEFIQTNKEVTLNGGIFAQIENNHFDVTHFGNNIDGGYGIFTDHSSGFNIRNNTFTCSDASPNPNVALELRKDIVYAAGTVTENDFEGTFAAANVFSGKNPNLTIDCNQYHYPIIWDWVLVAIDENGYLNDQGICFGSDPELARRNSFKPDADGIQYYNIYNATEANFTYNAQSPQFVPLTNVAMPGAVNVDECFDNEQHTHCAYDNPCNPDCWRQLLSETSDPDEQMRLYTALMQEQLRLQQIDEAKTDLEELQRLQAVKMLVATYVDEADSTNAVTKLAEIPLNTAENVEFVTLYLEILSGIQPPAGQGKAMGQQETLIRSMANDAGSAQNVLAQSLIATHYAEPFDKTPTVPPQLRLNATTPVSGILLYPNPAKNEVQVSMTIPEMLNGTKLYISDIQGRLIDQLPVNQTQLTLQTTSYPNGFYLLYLKTESGKVYTQKLVVIR